MHNGNKFIPNDYMEKAEAEYKAIDREQEEFERISRDCTIQGHNWEHFYGGGMRCTNCHEEN